MTGTLRRYWIVPVSVFLGIYVGLPLLAPLFMHGGIPSAGHAIYAIYALFCHQLPERSYFLFGSKLTYSLAEVQRAYQSTNNPLLLRQFIGNQAMGWKVAWSDRMVAMFISLWLLGLLWWPVRRKMKHLPWWGLVLFLLPMALDGTSHMVSDLAGIGQGFRDTNLWLAAVTGHVFSTSFYVGDAWGSFNSIMRILTGFLFGFGIVWYTYPYLDNMMNNLERAFPGRSLSNPGMIHGKKSFEPREPIDPRAAGG